MIRNRILQLTLAAFAAYGALGCESGGVGAPCIPEDEYSQEFSGFALQEVNVESRSFQCETRVCIVNHFQGRVSCPYGQLESDLAKPTTDRARCRVPGGDGSLCVDGSGNVAACGAGVTNVDEIRVPVDPQRIFRNDDDTVYCSCRCDGPDANARYCECPSGFVCEELVREIGVPGRGQLVGSYCIKPGTLYDPTHPPPQEFCNFPDADANRTIMSADGKKRNVADTCGKKNGQGSNPPL
ncbi:MAG TPA: hypothetical protein VMS65_10585 [Polyangiaceae bacterium]|nr:hypothetical protein [Polyangiaceae bacterium]